MRERERERERSREKREKQESWSFGQKKQQRRRGSERQRWRRRNHLCDREWDPGKPRRSVSNAQRWGKRRRGSMPFSKIGGSTRRGPWRQGVPRHSRRATNSVWPPQQSPASSLMAHEAVVFIDNLHREADSRALRWLIRMDGSILRIFISKKRRRNNRLGFAFVSLSSTAHVSKVLDKIHGRTFMGHKIFARRAKYNAIGIVSAGRSLTEQSRGASEMVAPTISPVEMFQAASQEGGHPNGVNGGAVRPGKVNRMDEVELENGGACVKTGREGVAVSESPSPVSNASEGGGASDGNGAVPQEGFAVEAGGACLEGRKEQLSNLGSRDSGARLHPQACCCGRPRCPPPEEPSPVGCANSPHACCKEHKAMTDYFNCSSTFVGGGYVWYGIPFDYWSSVPCSPHFWVFPGGGYWPVCPTQGYDPYGGYSQLHGWGSWHYNPGTGWFLGGREQSAPAAHVQNINVGVREGLVQGTMESGGRAPIIIRPPSGNNSGPDPVMEDIINNNRGVVENNTQWIDKLGNGVDMWVIDDPNSGASDAHCSKPGSEPIGTQDQLMEDDLEDIGLRSLFEDPEFPPGFEPARDPPFVGHDPEETAVKEEARKTLLFAKKLGCTVPNETLALSNYEKIIRAQKVSLRRSSHTESDESIEDSDRCSKSTSKDKSKRVRGAGPLGFGKFARVSKAALRGKKKAK